MNRAHTKKHNDIIVDLEHTQASRIQLRNQTTYISNETRNNEISRIKTLHITEIDCIMLQLNVMLKPLF